jgi:hypothetical protein
VVPACASLDCLTVFARSVDDGAAIMAVMESGNAGPADVWRRSSPLPLAYSPGAPLTFKFGVPGPEFLEWTGPGGVGAVSKRGWGEGLGWWGPHDMAVQAKVGMACGMKALLVHAAGTGRPTPH